MASTFKCNVYAINNIVLPTPRAMGFPSGACFFDTVPAAQALVAGVYGSITARTKNGWQTHQVVETVAALATLAG